MKNTIICQPQKRLVFTGGFMLTKGIVVSCQAEDGSSFNNTDSVLAFANAAQRGAAVGLRLRGVENVKVVRKNTTLPIIGLTKSKYKNSDLVLITPSYEDIADLRDAGADYVAVDATGRNGYEHILKAKQELNVKIIGDLSDIREADKAIESGCCMFTTALSGYTVNVSKNSWEPDFNLLRVLVDNFELPVLAEGRYWTLEHVKRAIDIGAYAVVIGSAITRPHLITEYFNSAF